MKANMMRAIMGALLLLLPAFAAVAATGGAPDFTAAERNWIRQHPVVTLAIDNTYPPLNFVNEAGELTGLSVDLVNAIGRKAGITIAYEGSVWPVAIERALRHEVDGIVNADATEERRNRLNFTIPYVTLPSALATLKTAPDLESIEDLDGAIVCVKRNSSHLQLLSARTKAVVLPIETIEDGLELVLEEEAFGVFDDVSVLGHLIAAYSFVNLKVNFLHYDDVVGVSRLGLRNDEPLMQSVFDKAIASLSKAEREGIQSRWLSVVKERTVIERRFDWAVFLKIVAPLAVLGFTFYALAIWHNRRLSRAVERSTRELRKSEEKYRDIFENSVVGVFQSTPGGRFITVNHALSAMLKYDSPEEMKRLISDMSTEYFADSGDDLLIRHMLEEKGHLEGFEHKARCKDGSTIWVSCSARVFFHDDTAVSYYEGVISDISERVESERQLKTMEKRLFQAQKMEAIGTLAGGIAHDFNNILAAIIGYAELLQMNQAPDSDEFEYTRQIIQAGGRAKELILQILTFSRQTEQDLKPVEIGVVVKEVVKLLRSSLPAEIEINRSIEGRSLVLGEPAQIHQILMNLCTNAGHAMRERGGVLTVELKNIELKEDLVSDRIKLKPGPYAQLTVSDTGPGIPAEHLDRVFDPFFTTKERGEGTGMGLAVVHGIVKSYKGAIAVYSEPGQGTSFKVFLPAIKRRPELELQGAKEIPGGTECLLFVDDEPALVDIARSQLGALGYRVTGSSGSREALRIFAGAPDDFDLVITDITMPGLPGDELARELRRVRRDVPIIICTGYSALITPETAAGSGIDAVLMKPVVLREMAETIRTVLDRGKSRR